MSNADNPYQSPQTVAAPVAPLVNQGALTENMLAQLKASSPWLRFAGILGFIGCGIMVFFGVIFLAVIPLLRTVMREAASEMGEFGNIFGGAFTFAFGGTMAVYFFGASVLFFFPSLFAYRFGSKIRSYLGTGADGDLEAAFKNNKSFWKFIGILAIIQLAFVPVLIIAGIGIALAQAF
jgi:hypothetical protein